MLMTIREQVLEYLRAWEKEYRKKGTVLFVRQEAIMYNITGEVMC
jgi:hypothetical protein